MKHIFILWIIWNVITFLMMGIDKWKAKHNKRRISEKTLLISAFLMGAVGSGAGMLVFHHKTRKLKFKILIPAALLFNIAVPAVIIYFMMNR